MNRRDELFLMAWMGSALLALFVAKETGLKVNTSASMPIGLWRVTSLSQPLKRGMIALFCMPDSPLTEMALERDYIGRGDCPSGAEPVLKPVAAVAGDTVVVSPQGISVNGEPLPNTAQLIEDPAGRALPAYPSKAYEVPDGEVWLLSTRSSLSWDARYFGPTSVFRIQNTATPVVVW